MIGSKPLKRILHIALTLGLVLLTASGSRAQLQPPQPLPEPQLRDFVSHLLRDKGKAGCKPPKCRILVSDFTLASGETSQLGMRLADQVAQDLSSLLDATQIIDRALLRKYLDTERIPADLLNKDEAICWLGKELAATTILTGITVNQDGKLRLSARLLSSNGKGAGRNEELTQPYDGDLTSDLASIDPYSSNGRVPQVVPSPGVFVAGMRGVTSPKCYSCPPPPFSPAARAAKFQAVVILTVVISADGQVRSATLLRGAPFGLNESSISNVLKWQFNPATKDGQPVAVIAPVEVSYRLY